MNILQKFFGRRAARPSWQVTCTLKQQEAFGTISRETSFDLAAATEEEACQAVLSHVRESQPGSSVESIKISRRH